ncbi:hypothetical protein [Streptomyces iconiensis]|uniref:Uncharacterized protein n=1 Tax=Streptomyces iconiensis TaxID=1384038 RepID=A0ABT7A7Y6_9ACTN|nr:hypothetical protein [Streptomyces iconiensis]MDJ1137447.1 hypothetical protein [Streptomyces iconiensis]
MFKDPRTTWDGPYPYDVLAPAGVTPETTHADMQDVSFELMTRRMMTPETQTAWNELRTVPRRLRADLVLYDVDPAAETPGELEATRTALSSHGVPPEAGACLALDSLCHEALDGLADELDGAELELPRIQDMTEFAEPVPPAFLDELIRFDR